MGHELCFRMSHFFIIVSFCMIPIFKCENSDPTGSSHSLSGILEMSSAERFPESFVHQSAIIDEVSSSTDSSSTGEDRLTSTLINSDSYTSQNPRTYDGESHNKILSQNLIPLPEGYNKLEIPVTRTKDGNISSYVYVKVSIFIRRILDIDEKKEVITMDTDFRVQWVDWKIYHHLWELNFIDPVTKQKIVSRTVSVDGLEKIWKPDIFIDEMDSVEITSILEKLVTLQFLGQTHDADQGDIVYSSRDTLKLRCSMNFHYFPADTQTCKFRIRSYSHNASYLVLRWGNTSKEGVYLNDPTDPNFTIMIDDVKPKNRSLRSNDQIFIHERFDHFRIGKYSLLTFSIKIRRKLSYHVVQTYLPSVILILITWLCFMLPTNMVEARIGISMTTLLTLTAMFSSVRQQSPEVSYTMAIDIWMVFCILCVFVALLLFTLIYWMKRSLKPFLETNSESAVDIEKDIQKTMNVYEKVVKFSKVYAFWALATVFITFMCVYWFWLMTASEHYEWNPDLRFNADTLNKTTDLYRCLGKNVNETEGMIAVDC